MTRPTFAALALLLAAGLSVGCSGGDEDAPPAFSLEGEAAELYALDIDANEEPIADEEEVTFDEEGDVVLPGDPAADEENPLADDEEEEASIETLSLSPLVGPGEIPGAEFRGTVASRKCRLNGQNVPGCRCVWSPLNCQVPNTQKGRNRYLPPAFEAEMNKRVSALRATGQKVTSPVDGGKWHVAAGTTLYDGTGVPRGRVVAANGLPPAPGNPNNVCITWAGPDGVAFAPAPGTCAKINFGAKKRIRPAGGAEQTFVYAFNVLIDVGPTGLDVSGWIPLAAIEGGDRELLRKMPTAATRRITRASSFASTGYVIKSARDYGQDPATFSAGNLPAWSRAKVALGEGSKKVGDYVLRDGNVWNLAYNTPGVGGVATDTFIVPHDTLSFRRVKSTRARPTLVRVKVYDSPMKSLVFAYGAVKTTTGERFGWAALPAIKKGRVASGAVSRDVTESCKGKADGTYCAEYAAIAGYTCRGGRVTASLLCDAPTTKCKGPSPDGAKLVCDL